MCDQDRSFKGACFFVLLASTFVFVLQALALAALLVCVCLLFASTASTQTVLPWGSCTLWVHFLDSMFEFGFLVSC